MNEQTRANFETYLSKCQTLVARRGVTLSIEEGRRYIRIVETGGGSSRSVFGFVDKTNGDVLKAATWKAPAKHARGNVNDAHNGMGSMTEYGPAYLTGSTLVKTPVGV